MFWVVLPSSLVQPVGHLWGVAEDGLLSLYSLSLFRA